MPQPSLSPPSSSESPLSIASLLCLDQTRGTPPKVNFAVPLLELSGQPTPPYAGLEGCVVCFWVLSPHCARHTSSNTKLPSDPELLPVPGSGLDFGFQLYVTSPRKPALTGPGPHQTLLSCGTCARDSAAALPPGPGAPCRSRVGGACALLCGTPHANPEARDMELPSSRMHQSLVNQGLSAKFSSRPAFVK